MACVSSWKRGRKTKPERRSPGDNRLSQIKLFPEKKLQRNFGANRAGYLLAGSGPSSERVFITRSMESRVTMPTICGASSMVPLTTGI